MIRVARIEARPVAIERRRPAVHCAIPVPASGPGHTLLHDPQCDAFVCSSTHVPLQSCIPPSHVTGPSWLTSPPVPVSLGVPVSPGVPVSLPLPVSTTVTSAPSPSVPESPPGPHELVSLHVPNASVPHALTHAAAPATPTQSPTVTK
jgi:hypothetical protein